MQEFDLESFGNFIREKLFDSMIIFLLFGILVFDYGANINLQLFGVKEYQVTIDESVSVVDFTSKYDIIRVDGEIYTIREKENE